MSEFMFISFLRILVRTQMYLMLPTSKFLSAVDRLFFLFKAKNFGNFVLDHDVVL